MGNIERRTCNPLPFVLEELEANNYPEQHAGDDIVWGVVYRIEKSQVENVKDYLDIREINGYSIHMVEVHPVDPNARPIQATVYIGTPDNPQFVGNPPPRVEELAKHICVSSGPSGENRYGYSKCRVVSQPLISHVIENTCTSYTMR